MTDVLDHADAPAIAAIPDDELPPPEIDARPPSKPIRFLAWLGGLSVESWITFVVVAGGVVITLANLHPDLLLRNTTPTGGDMGAHVWGPAFLRDHILPHGRLSGWAPDWYDGFPAYQFYMVLPALAVVAVNVILPYGIALKLVSIMGVLTLPIAAWAFAKLSGLRFPAPPLFAAVAVIYLWDETFTIYGGNIASTMAGEFSFSIALSIGLVALGFVANGLRTGRYRALAAALIAISALSHLLVAFFVVAGAGGMVVVHLVQQRRFDRLRFKWAATTGVVAGLLVMFWMLPFWARRSYMTDMGYEKRTDYVNMLFPQTFKWDVFIGALAALGLIFTFVRRSRIGLWLVLMTVGYGAWAVLWPQSHLWNARLLPFLYLSRYLLCAYGVAELFHWIADGVRTYSSRRSLATGARNRRIIVSAGAVLGALFVVISLGMRLEFLPFGRNVTIQTKSGSVTAYQWLGLQNTKPEFVNEWAAWNYTGYEGKPAYGEYFGLNETMANVGKTNGCGRAEWEYDGQLNSYGTPMALMLLPFWTNGCISSMEGLFFEASATTPYHFLANSALSLSPSRPVRKLRYDPLDVDKGVKYMQLLGVKYYMAFTKAAVTAADKNADLKLVAQTGPWRVYEVAKSDIVQGLTNLPAVQPGLTHDRQKWLDTAQDFFLDPTKYDVEIAATGPKDWQRITKGQQPTKTPVAPVTVTNIQMADDRITFDVDHPGTPVLVKASYFPNWHVSGADGPYRVAPNLMVVIPRATHVSLRYGYTPVDYLAYFLTFLGLVGLVWLARQKRIAYPEPPAMVSADPFAPHTWRVDWDGWDTWDEWDAASDWDTLGTRGNGDGHGPSIPAPTVPENPPDGCGKPPPTE